MPSIKLWVLVDLESNTVMSVFRSLGEALSEYNYLSGGLFRSFNFGIFLFSPQEICPIGDNAANKVK